MQLSSQPNSDSPPSAGRLLALLTACFYVLFTLLPDSHSLMVQWSWVFIWQVGLLCPVIWLLGILWQQKHFKGLGLGLDWIILLIILGIIFSSLFAQFPNQGRWYGWAALCFVSTLYALRNWVDSSQAWEKLLIFQGYLNVVFVLVSLILWTTQTLLPELTRLNAFQKVGVNLPFDFSSITLRNWAPIGHQNYVAGYLLLALPLFVALAIKKNGWQRWLWGTGIALGLLDLYTTSSRGGWLGLFVLVIVSFIILLFQSKISRLWLGIGGISSLFLIILLALANNRLWTLVIAVLQGKSGGEFAYRLINAHIGWNMGNSHPLTGIGLGGVPLLYQKYRPIWAGRESELAYQLHSTPVQLWAEMGIWGILPVLGGIIFLTYHGWRWLSSRESSETFSDSIFVWSLSGGLLAYGVMSLTDYQLDNVAISGTLVIYLGCLTFLLQRHSSPTSVSLPSYFTYGGLGILLVVIIWLIPIHRAWQLSSQGFAALRQEKLELFVKWVGRSHELVPWEPYYPLQLGWNLGDMSLKTPDPQLRLPLLNESISWLQKGTKASPYGEFGYTNLGWLLLQKNPVDGMKAFAESAKLVPAKRGVMYGLGLSLLAQNKPELALEAFTLEGLRDPLFMTSPLWNSPTFQSIYPQVLAQMVTRYTELLEKPSQPEPFKSSLHRSRGGIYWWQGNLKEAQKDLEKYGTSLSQGVLALAEGKSFANNIASPASLVIEAWKNPKQRPILLQKAWIQATQTEFLPEIQQQLLSTMEKSTSFEQWLRENAPFIQYRRERSGFGVLSRHIDGSIPTDFWLVVDNIPMTTWFEEMLPSPLIEAELDLALQPWRDNLLQQIKGLK